jgi:hypothetical protein
VNYEDTRNKERIINTMFSIIKRIADNDKIHPSSKEIIQEGYQKILSLVTILPADKMARDEEEKNFCYPKNILTM